ISVRLGSTFTGPRGALWSTTGKTRPTTRLRWLMATAGGSMGRGFRMDATGWSQSRRAPMRDIDRLLAKAQDLIDQAWRTAQTKREVIALVDAYHDVRRGRANLHLALTPQPVKYRPPSRSKLTPEQVREIRARWEAGGVTQAQLAEEYGVHLKHMQHIVRGRVWKGVA